ncbi:ribosome maturation factor RimP [Porphyromonas somerae]|nr:ribosome maturation factor RimP [Porphyromonas somerae]
MRISSFMIEIRDIETLVASFIAEHEGFFLVKAEVKGANRIEVEVDHDSEPVDIDTIVALTKHIEAGLDREKEDFELEVSSAGLTTPLVGVRRYRKFIGKELEVLLKKGVKEKGVLVSADEEGFVLEVIRMEKPEGARRKQQVVHQLPLKYEEVKQATYLLKV